MVGNKHRTVITSSLSVVYGGGGVNSLALADMRYRVYVSTRFPR